LDLARLRGRRTPLASPLRAIRSLHELLRLVRPHLRVAGRRDCAPALAELLGLGDPVRRRAERGARSPGRHPRGGRRERRTGHAGSPRQALSSWAGGTAPPAHRCERSYRIARPARTSATPATATIAPTATIGQSSRPVYGSFAAETLTT